VGKWSTRYLAGHEYLQKNNLVGARGFEPPTSAY
jgi:hypothetical protein